MNTHTVSALLIGLCLAHAGCSDGSSSGSSSSTSAGSSAASTGAAIYLQDAPPVTLVDQFANPVFEMSELWLTISGAKLEGVNSGDVPLTLASAASTIQLDVMTLDTSARLLALGTFPADDYEGLELDVTAAEMVGTDLVTGLQARVSVVVPQSEWEAEFQGGAVFLDPNTPTNLVIDWRPSVRATTVGAQTSYELRDEVHAFVPGSSGASGGTANPVTDVEGDLTAIDCAALWLEITHHGAVTRVQFNAQTVFEDDNGNALANGCADLVVGDELDIEGTLTGAGGGLVATLVEAESNGGGGSGGGHDVEGDVVAIDCAAGTLTVDDNGALIQVTFTPQTPFLDDDGNALPNHCHDVAVGDEVEVDGSFNAAGVLVATQLESEDFLAPVAVGGSFDDDGIVRNLTTNAAGFIEFDLEVSGQLLAHVVTDARTEFEDASGATIPQTGVTTGANVEVEGTLTAVGAPLTVLAEDVELQ